MEKRLVRDFLAVTFLIDALGWGLAAVLSQTLGLLLTESIPLKMLFFLGGMSPTIASYLTLRRYGRVTGLKDWLVKIFSPGRAWVYLLVVLFWGLYYALGRLISGGEPGAPFGMLFLLTPMMLLGGGNEEVGWRMILQPELEKTMGFPAAALLTGVIWWLWHTPLFFIQGTANATLGFLPFGLMCVALSFALGAVVKCSGRVFPAVLLHCLVNAGSTVFPFAYCMGSALAVFAALAAVSLLVEKAVEKRQTER